jgi:hypothetical protein
VKLGTRSLLFGAHQFVLHPIFLAIAWTKLFGPPVDPRLWVAFIVHDLGYFGLPNMDGPEGKRHVEFGAAIMNLFGKEWGDFARYHSRSYAQLCGAQPSRLCAADKLATCLVPTPLYLFLVNLTGEVEEYLANAKETDQRVWHQSICDKSLLWIAETFAAVD